MDGGEPVAMTLAEMGLDGLVADLMARDRVPGMTIGILDGGETSFAADGVTNLETGVPVVPETVMQIGSISKVFLGTLVMGLVEEGWLDLDRPIVETLPGFRLADEAATRVITIRHCLTHMTGFEGDRFDDHGRGDDALARCVEGYATLAQQLPPATTFSYCNTGFNLVGRVVEVVLGQPYEQAMRERVFEPLGLTRATFFADDAILQHNAAGHLTPPAGEDSVARPWPLTRNTNPAGGIITDVAELLRFAAAHLGLIEVPAPFPSMPTRLAMRERQVEVTPTTGRGLTWSLERRADEPAVGHGGATNGFKASLLLLPDRGFAIAMLTNGENGVYTERDVERAILSKRFGIEDTDPEPIALTPGVAGTVTGQYHAMLAELTVAGDDDGLTVTTIGINPFTHERGTPLTAPIAPVGDDTFIVSEGVRKGTSLQFLPDGAGRFTMLRAGGRVALRVDA